MSPAAPVIRASGRWSPTSRRYVENRAVPVAIRSPARSKRCTVPASWTSMLSPVSRPMSGADGRPSGGHAVVTLLVVDVPAGRVVHGGAHCRLLLCVCRPRCGRRRGHGPPAATRTERGRPRRSPGRRTCQSVDHRPSVPGPRRRLPIAEDSALQNTRCDGQGHPSAFWRCTVASWFLSPRTRVFPVGVPAPTRWVR